MNRSSSLRLDGSRRSDNTLDEELMGPRFVLEG